VQARLSVNSFTVVLVKPCYDLARANISDFFADVVKQNCTTKVTGKLDNRAGFSIKR